MLIPRPTQSFRESRRIPLFKGLSEPGSAQSARGSPQAAAPLAALLVVGVALALWTSRIPAQGPSPTSAARRHVLVISADGLGASFYVNPPPDLHIPNLLRLKQEGSSAEGVIGV